MGASSDPTPAKPANKAERSTAELVEGDDGTERNAELQSTVRTQSREAVTQAQARCYRRCNSACFWRHQLVACCRAGVITKGPSSAPW
jgi:hypothetical protein